MEEFINILTELVKQQVPEGNYTIDGSNVSIVKNGDQVEIEINKVDPKLTERIEYFKDSINRLNSDVFIRAMEKMGNTKYFSDLLEKNIYSPEEAELVVAYLDKASEVIRNEIEEEIENLENLLEEF